MMDDRRAFFETLAQDWDDRQPSDRNEVLHRLLVPFMELIEDSNTLLEVGTGTGALIPILNKLAPNASLVSLDLATAMLLHARKRCPTALLIQADVYTLPLLPGHFDFVICHNSYAHFVHKDKALSEMWNLLSPGGHLLILHDISREHVNQVHLCARASIIHDDLLPAAVETKRLMADAGFVKLHTWDTDDRYVAIGSRQLEM